jgi:hypothetical protein
MDGEVGESEEGVVGAGAPAEATGPTGGAPAGEALALAREALIAAHPDAVPELIGGSTVDDLRGSVTAAKAAFARALETARATLAAERVSPGAAARTLPVNAEAMSPSAKIAWAIKQRS